MIYSYTQIPESAKVAIGNDKHIPNTAYFGHENGSTIAQGKVDATQGLPEVARGLEKHASDPTRKILAGLSLDGFNKRNKTSQLGNFQSNRLEIKGRFNNSENANQDLGNSNCAQKVTHNIPEENSSLHRQMKQELDQLIKEKLQSENNKPTKEFHDFKSEMEQFYGLFKAYLEQKKKTVDWNKIRSINPKKIKSYNDLKEKHGTEELATSENLKRLAVLKLNGGLGTTMGCVGPKSAIDVRDGKSFLDLTIQQIESLNLSREDQIDVPLILMNSFNTNEKTKYLLQKYDSHKVNIRTFNQSRFPRIAKTTLLPIVKGYHDCKEQSKGQTDSNNKGERNFSNVEAQDEIGTSLSPPYSRKNPYLTENEAWYPPGHGNLFYSLDKSGILDDLLTKGKDILFVSNIDNLGATVDPCILSYMTSNGISFIMEVTEKTECDIKGGTLIEYQDHNNDNNEDSNLRLLEVAQVPPGHIKNFNNIQKFKFFNTNNIWIDLRTLRKVLDEKTLALDVIQNEKTLEKTDQKIIQLETAIGSAIQNFPSAMGINVPRKRFLPVKSTSDLLVVQSDLYTLSEGHLIMSQRTLNNRQFCPIPIIKLGNHFKKVQNYLDRISHGVPSLLECDHLSISGDVSFGSNVVIKGTVIIVANPGCHIDIPSGSTLQDKVISGNFHILDR